MSFVPQGDFEVNAEIAIGAVRRGHVLFAWRPGLIETPGVAEESSSGRMSLAWLSECARCWDAGEACHSGTAHDGCNHGFDLIVGRMRSGT